MPRWVATALTRIRALAAERKVMFTLKARRELAELGAGMDESDACDLLASLSEQDSAGRLQSNATGEWMYLFKPTVAGAHLYLKLLLRGDCIVVSFHEDQEEDQTA